MMHEDRDNFVMRNVAKACESQKNSILSPSTEFSAITHLEKLLSNHQDWEKFKSILQKGCDYKMKPQVDEEVQFKKYFTLSGDYAGIHGRDHIDY